MPTPVTVVVNCAGSGSRLGLGKTKALADILGRPLVVWQLEMLKGVADVRIAVGCDAPEVIEVAKNYRRDVIFVFNHDYANTGTAASLSLAAAHVAGDVISLDADLIVHPADFRKLLETEENMIGVTEPTTDEPVYAQIDEATNKVVSFNRTGPGKEWSGLVRVRADMVHAMKARGLAERHVFEMLTPLLPFSTLSIRCREIDTPDDYFRAIEWLETLRNGEGEG